MAVMYQEESGEIFILFVEFEIYFFVEPGEVRYHRYNHSMCQQQLQK